ncbi:hypothetical protein SOM70_36685 [Streptomyces salinarius]|uniref:hypothetical protein n=1 Tax=Streptomyces salinarius TaxID=2762598 RepID=UPI0032DF4B8B
MREHIEAARHRQGRAAASDARAGAKEPTGWKLEKQLLQEDNRRLREEVGRLKAAVRRSLGQQLDQFGAADLGTRVDELTTENQRLQAERDDALARVKDLTEQLSETQDDLASARISLRRMIRARTLPERLVAGARRTAEEARTAPPRRGSETLRRRRTAADR